MQPQFVTRPGTLDNWIVDEVRQGAYTRYFQVEPTDVVADVGANIGAFSIFAAQAAAKGAVYAFEPQPDNYDTLVKDLQINGIDNVIARNAAVGSAPGWTKISSRKMFNMGGYSVGHGDVDVPVVTLDSELQRVDFLKVDTEGSEMDVLEGARRLLGENRVYVAMETHGSDLNAEVVDFLTSIGYTVRNEWSGLSFHGFTYYVWAWKG